MSGTHTDAIGVMIQADLDGELDAVQAADLALHVAGCAECRTLTEELRALKTALRRELPRYQAPPALREALLAKAGGKAARPSRAWHFSWRRLFPVFEGFAAGAAIAAVLAVLLLPQPPAEEGRVAAEVATATERSLLPDHLLDFQSATAPELARWFRARMGFSPPIRQPAGFSLAGGRLDYLHHRPVAVLVYRHPGGPVELYAWPEAHVPTAAKSLAAAGFALSYWREGGIEYWAVGRSRAALAQFAALWHQSA